LASAAQAGLLQVLVRMSGSQAVGENTLIATSIRDPNAYYSQYSYESTDRVLQVAGEPVPAILLRILFEPSAVAKLLRRAGFSVWGSNRPGILLWLALSDEQGRRLLSEIDVSDNISARKKMQGNNFSRNNVSGNAFLNGAVSTDSVPEYVIPQNNAHEIITILQDQARLRGLPLLFPLLDLEDSASLSTAEVWGAFLGRIDEASLRYNPGSVLTARIQKDSVGRWSANWSYRVDRNWQVAKTVSFDIDEMVRTMVDKLADELAARYAIDSSRGQVMIVIEAVENVGDYASVSRYLESLAPVLDSFVVRVESSEVEFRLNTEGQNEQLVETIQLDEKMVLLNANERKDVLHYLWLN